MFTSPFHWFHPFPHLLDRPSKRVTQSGHLGVPILGSYPRNHCFWHLFGPPFWGPKTGQNMSCEKHVFAKSKVLKTLPLPFKVFAPYSVFAPCFWHGTHRKMGPKTIDFGVPSLDLWVSSLDTLFDPSGTVIHRSSGSVWDCAYPCHMRGIQSPVTHDIGIFHVRDDPIPSSHDQSPRPGPRVVIFRSQNHRF